MHTAGATGAGVKVGVVDGGFGGLALRQADGDLPAALTTQSFCSAGIDGETDHGTAVAEIVHEMAPAAQLYLICIEDEVDLGAAKDYAIANGIQILNFSGSFMNSSRGDGSADPEHAERDTCRLAPERGNPVDGLSRKPSREPLDRRLRRQRRRNA